jgi:hypothetical protein
MKTYSKSQLAKKYGVNYNTFKKWLMAIPEIKIVPTKRLLTPKDVEIIYKHLGLPN